MEEYLEWKVGKLVHSRLIWIITSTTGKGVVRILPFGIQMGSLRPSVKLISVLYFLVRVHMQFNSRQPLNHTYTQMINYSHGKTMHTHTSYIRP